MAFTEKAEYAPKIVVKHFSLCLESKVPLEGYKPITSNNPDTGEPVTKYYRQFSAVDGYLNKIEWYSREYDGKPYRGVLLHLEDEAGITATIDLAYGKKPLETFTKLAANIDYSQPVVFSAFKGREGDLVFIAKQNGETVKWAHTKENPNGMPEPQQNRRTGKWDFTATNDWLLEQLLDHIAPQVEQFAKHRNQQPAQPRQAEPTKDKKRAAIAKALGAQAPARAAVAATAPRFSNNEPPMNFEEDDISF